MATAAPQFTQYRVGGEPGEALTVSGGLGGAIAGGIAE